MADVEGLLRYAHGDETRARNDQITHYNNQFFAEITPVSDRFVVKWLGMDRKLYQDLLSWKVEKQPKPLLIRGARQVGKSYLVNQFGKENFKNFLSVNFEKQPQLKKFFEYPNPDEILAKLSGYLGVPIELGETLIFIDEIQECSQALIALRYFYEERPGLHVIGAGSLLDFTLSNEEISMPVGRIQYLYMDPMSFAEYLTAVNKKSWLGLIKQSTIESPLDLEIHNRLVGELRNYMLLGGMPKVLATYTENQDNLQGAIAEQDPIIDTYRDDFKKYSSRIREQYLRRVFNSMPQMVGKKFMYSRVDSESKSRDIKYALELLEQACLVKKIKHSSPHARPLEAGVSEKIFKTIFLDCGLLRNISGTRLDDVMEYDFKSSEMGSIAEQYVGQELVALQSPLRPRYLHYWVHENKESSAEIDYMISIEGRSVPIEVKSGANGKLKSLKRFMEEYSSPIGIKISEAPLSFDGEILSLPLYMVSELLRIVQNMGIASQ